jgi:hypothetical protein
MDRIHHARTPNFYNVIAIVAEAWCSLRANCDSFNSVAE